MAEGSIAPDLCGDGTVQRLFAAWIAGSYLAGGHATCAGDHTSVAGRGPGNRALWPQCGSFQLTVASALTPWSRHSLKLGCLSSECMANRWSKPEPTPLACLGCKCFRSRQRHPSAFITLEDTVRERLAHPYPRPRQTHAPMSQAILLSIRKSIRQRKPEGEVLCAARGAEQSTPRRARAELGDDIGRPSSNGRCHGEGVHRAIPADIDVDRLCAEAGGGHPDGWGDHSPGNLDCCAGSGIPGGHHRPTSAAAPTSTVSRLFE